MSPKKTVSIPALEADREAASFGYTAERWLALEERDRELHRLVRPIRSAAYKVDQPLHRIKETLDQLDVDQKSLGGGLTLNPDFQRGHVWSPEKQVAYIENLLRGWAPTLIKFNCPSWQAASAKKAAGDLPLADMVCVDGLQRLTAVLRFMADDLVVFGRLRASDLKGTSFDPARFRLQFEVFELKTRADLLTFYIDLNAGGVVHSDEEIERVRALRDRSSEEPTTSAKPKRKP